MFYQLSEIGTLRVDRNFIATFFSAKVNKKIKTSLRSGDIITTVTKNVCCLGMIRNKF